MPFAALAALFCLFALSTGADAQQWVLDNGKVSLVLAFNPQSGLFTKNWRDLDAQTDLIQENESRASNCKEFEVQVDGSTLLLALPMI